LIAMLSVTNSSARASPVVRAKKAASTVNVARMFLIMIGKRTCRRFRVAETYEELVNRAGFVNQKAHGVARLELL
jgi:hypothetical protein